MIIAVSGSKNNGANGKIEAKQRILNSPGENNQRTDGGENRTDQTPEDAFDFFLFPQYKNLIVKTQIKQITGHNGDFGYIGVREQGIFLGEIMNC